MKNRTVDPVALKAFEQSLRTGKRSPLEVRPITANTEKILRKERGYKEKAAVKPFQSVKVQKESHEYFNLLYFSLHCGKFATDALNKRGHLLGTSGIHVVLTELDKTVDVFREKLSQIGEKDLNEFNDFLTEMENFAAEYISLTKEDREKAAKYLKHLHKKRA